MANKRRRAVLFRNLQRANRVTDERSNSNDAVLRDHQTRITELETKAVTADATLRDHETRITTLENP